MPGTNQPSDGQMGQFLAVEFRACPWWAATPARIAGFVLMLLRSIQVAVGNYIRGYSVLERPGAFDPPGA